MLEVKNFPYVGIPHTFERKPFFFFLLGAYNLEEEEIIVFDCEKYFE